MGLVKGFTDIIAPQNLTTNGRFQIDQRAFPVGILRDLKTGDFLCDAWYVYGTTLDYLQGCRVISTASGAYLKFKGYGKKGQYLIVRSSDNSEITGAPIHGGLRTYITAAASIGTTSTSVPTKTMIFPKFRIGDFNTPYYTPLILSPQKLTGDVVTVHETACRTNASAYLRIDLLADGEYEIFVGNFRELAGSYVNPPMDTYPTYADDLLRCKRYYQKGVSIVTGVGNDSGSEYSIRNRHFFEVQMAGTPTINVTNPHIEEVGSTTDVVGNYTLMNLNISSSYFDGYALKSRTGALPQKFYYDWTATV